MAMRDDARRLIDGLPESDMPIVVRFLRGLQAVPAAGPDVAAMLDAAPVDDEPLSADDRAVLADVDADMATGRVTMVPAEEMRRRILG